MKTTAIVLGFVFLFVMAAIGWWRYYSLRNYISSDAKAFDTAAALVMLTDRDTLCEVSDTNHTPKQKMPLSEVVAYLQDQLKVQPGSKISVAALGKVPADRIDAVSVELKKSGYAIVREMRVGFITEPEPNR